MKALVYISQVYLQKVVVRKLAGCKLQREVLTSIVCKAYCSILLAITANSSSGKLHA